MKKPKFYITPHAAIRMRERLPCEDDVYNLYKDFKAAISIGELLTDKERKHLFMTGLSGKDYWRRNFRKYKNHIFIFQIKSGRFTLITVI